MLRSSIYRGSLALCFAMQDKQEGELRYSVCMCGNGFSSSCSSAAGSYVKLIQTYALVSDVAYTTVLVSNNPEFVLLPRSTLQTCVCSCCPTDKIWEKVHRNKWSYRGKGRGRKRK